MKVAVTVLFALLLSLGALAQTRDPLARARELVSAKNLTTGRLDTQTRAPRHIIFSEGQYVHFAAAVNRAKFEKPRSQMTREELLERDNAEGQYGTYRIEGNKVTRTIASAMDPNNEGRETTSEFRIDGDILIVTGVNRQGQVTEDRYRKLH